MKKKNDVDGDPKTEFIDDALDYITEGRLASVRSKILEDVPFYGVAVALAGDALGDIATQEENRWVTATLAEKEKIRKAVTDAAFRLVKRVVE